MRFSHQLTYDASPDEVAAMLADRTFRARVCEAMHATRFEVSVDGEGAGMNVLVDQTQQAAGLPSFASRLVGDRIRIVQRETWSSPTAAHLELEIPGKPGGLDGGIALASDGDRTVETVSGDVKVKIPLVGGKLEDLVSTMLAKALRTEEKVGRDWLAARGRQS